MTATARQLAIESIGDLVVPEIAAQVVAGAARLGTPALVVLAAVRSVLVPAARIIVRPGPPSLASEAGLVEFRLWFVRGTVVVMNEGHPDPIALVHASVIAESADGRLYAELCRSMTERIAVNARAFLGRQLPVPVHWAFHAVYGDGSSPAVLAPFTYRWATRRIDAADCAQVCPWMAP